jgi:hypothetical protein
VWVWGNPYYGGYPNFGPGGSGSVTKISDVYPEFPLINMIYSTKFAFAAVDFTGEVWVWGVPDSGGSPTYGGSGNLTKISALYPEFTPINTIYSNSYSFAAVDFNGEVWIWGSSYTGGSIIDPILPGAGDYTKLPGISGITQIYSTTVAFAAVNGVGEVWVWGEPSSGGSSTYNPANPVYGLYNTKLTSIDTIYSTWSAFAALEVKSLPPPSSTTNTTALVLFLVAIIVGIVAVVLTTFNILPIYNTQFTGLAVLTILALIVIFLILI